MSTQATVPVKQPVKITKAGSNMDDVFKRMEELTHRIAKRAHELFTFRGFENGHDLDDWFAAERELLVPSRLEVKDGEREYTATLDVPGFDPPDITVQIDGNEVVVTGEQHKETEKKEDKGATIYSEKTAKELYRRFELPTAVVADKATATLNRGVLELKLPKVAASVTIPTKAA